MKVRRLTLTALLSALLIASAWISIPLPFSPVPLTLQSFVVLLLPVVVQPDLALHATLVYLLLGAMGLPVFANYRAGLDVLMGPTGGYLMGFLVAQVFIGYSKGSLFLRLCGAQALIYLCGVSWLARVLQLSLVNAVLLGLAPYLIMDALKILAVLTIAPRLKSLRF